MNRGFTLIELLIVLLVGVVIVMTGYQAIHVMAEAEKTTDKASQRAITEARLTEQLLRDLRSSQSVTKRSDSDYTISRWVLGAQRMEKREVTWKLENKTRVTRECTGEPRQDYDFDGLLNPDEPAFKLRLEKVPDATFTDPTAPAGTVP